MGVHSMQAVKSRMLSKICSIFELHNLKSGTNRAVMESICRSYKIYPVKMQVAKVEKPVQKTF
jgi:hypothetical protein